MAVTATMTKSTDEPTSAPSSFQSNEVTSMAITGESVAVEAGNEKVAAPKKHTAKIGINKGARK